MTTRHSTTTFLPDANRVEEAVLCPARVNPVSGGVADVEALAERCVR